ncbi:sialidase family protein [Kribbella solani]|uniref:sialidase family protein n=1 Tax=Kribbella solani TaxID=236067 RepID=UPI0029B28711|nr:sialidase family protein [Kribbella solani]MDX2970534.1 sialidase family protein [Kribbella solani]MDX3003543.1 sialidase family protein [Kribbella solani]
MTTTRSRLLLSAAVILATSAVVAQSSATGVSAAVPVSGTSPLQAGCGAGPADGYTLYPNTEVQPHLAVDPKHPSHLVTAYQQDRWNRYGSNGAVTSVSNDGGASWHRSAALPPFSACTGGAYDVTTDHWLTITPSGAAIAASFSLSRDGEITAMQVARSGDGGEHWADAVTLQRDTTSKLFNDRPAVTADPYHPGVVYTVWDRVEDTSTDSAEHSVQPVYLSKSTDDGRTWSKAKKIYDVPDNTGTIGTVLTPLADGTLLIGMHYLTATAGATQVIRSTDGGATWSKPTLNAPAPLAVTTRIPDPDGGSDPIRNASLPLLAAQPGTKVVHATWQSQAADGTFHVAYARSADSGKTWSAPARVDKTPKGSAAVPAIAVSSDGTAAITYYDFRNNTADSSLPTDFWAITCKSACTTAGSWTEKHLEGPFDARKVPATSSGRMLGDYTGLVSTGKSFVAVYGVATGNTNNPVDLHSTTF